MKKVLFLLMFPIIGFGQITPEIISFLDTKRSVTWVYQELVTDFSEQLENSKHFFSESTELSFSDAIKEASTFNNIKEGWSGTHDKVLPIHKFLFLQDKNVYRDNAMTVFSILKFQDDFESLTGEKGGYQTESTYNDIKNNYIQLIKSDKDPLQLFFTMLGGSYKANPHFYQYIYKNEPPYKYNSTIESINFIFNDDKSTLIKFKKDEIYLKIDNEENDDARIFFGINADIQSLLTSLKKYSKADIKIEYRNPLKKVYNYKNGACCRTEYSLSEIKSAYATMNLSGSSAAINKIQGNYSPTIKNSGYIYKMGLVNSNPFDLEKYVDKFILDAKANHGIDLSYVNRNERLIMFRQLERETIALAYKMDDDEKVLVLVDPENWNNANQALRYYIIYHELGHDILNLEHGEGGRMMNPYKEGNYSWSRFETDKKEMFSNYKPIKNYSGFNKIKKESTSPFTENSNNYSSIIIGSFGAKANAERQKQTLIKEGFDNIDISKVGNVYRVSVLVSGSKEKVQEVHKRVKVNHKSAWISYN